MFTRILQAITLITGGIAVCWLGVRTASASYAEHQVFANTVGIGGMACLSVACVASILLLSAGAPSKT